MSKELEIVGLYEFDDEYQVMDENRTVWFQGRKADCKKYIVVHQLDMELSNRIRKINKIIK